MNAHMIPTAGILPVFLFKPVQAQCFCNIGILILFQDDVGYEFTSLLLSSTFAPASFNIFRPIGVSIRTPTFSRIFSDSSWTRWRSSSDKTLHTVLMAIFPSWHFPYDHIKPVVVVQWVTVANRRMHSVMAGSVRCSVIKFHIHNRHLSNSTLFLAYYDKLSG